VKFLQIGLGSMGKRRIRNLIYLNYRDIVGYDIREDRLKEAKELYGIDVVDDLEKVNIDEITHIIISTPPDRHAEYVLWGLKHNKHIFIEASVVDDKYKEIIELSKAKDVLVAPSSTMRFDPINIKVKEILDSKVLGKKVFLQHHFGLYLPYWHPYEDIKDFYVSNRDTGGAREIVPFDLVYISWFVGLPKGDVYGLISKSDILKVDIDDIYSLGYISDESCHVQFTIDVISKRAYRTTRIVCENGSIDIDTVKGEVVIFYSKDNRYEIYSRNQLSKTKSCEEMYILEIENFIEASLGKREWSYTLRDDWKILNILYKAESNFKNRI